MGNNNPIIAGILSFLIPGLGHGLICKNWKKGIVLFVVAVIAAFVGMSLFGLLSLLYGLFCGYDAYMEAQGKPLLKF